jgi:hypothetical protein
MASGAGKSHSGVFTGAASLITVSTVPFTPKRIEFYATGGIWGVKIYGQTGMDGANYLSNTAADVGVTFTASGFTVANGADVNSSGNPVYYTCYDVA